jgi:hypothetical protein
LFCFEWCWELNPGPCSSRQIFYHWATSPALAWWLRCPLLHPVLPRWKPQSSSAPHGCQTPTWEGKGSPRKWTCWFSCEVSLALKVCAWKPVPWWVIHLGLGLCPGTGAPSTCWETQSL